MCNALELIGCAFTPGGDSPSEGFDCYGLLRYVRGHYFDLPTPIAGAELERANLASTTRAIAATRASGAWRQVAPPGAPGDCVLLGRRSASTPSHIGVALEAGVLHAYGGARAVGGSVVLTPWPRVGVAFGGLEVWTCPARN